MVAQSHKIYNILALDVGEARIGVAMANSLAKLPQPLSVIPNGPEVFKGIIELLTQNQAQLIIVGLPRDVHGAETAQSGISRAFAEELKKHTKIPIQFADESLSSKRAEEVAKELKRDPAAHLDDIAACFILEEYLRSQNDTI